MATTGYASEIKPDTIPMTLMRTAITRGENDAIFVQRNGKTIQWTWNEYYADIMKFAKSL